MKRIILLFSALMLSCIALWAHDVEIDYIYYNLDEEKKTAEVTYSGAYYYSVSDEYSGSVTIPETITYNSEIYSVTSIDRRAFSGCSGLASVTIPNSVTSIGDAAFYNCSGLTSVTIPNSVTSIGSVAFNSCSGLTEVTIGNSVTFIGDEAFEGCSGLTKVNYLGTVDKWVDIDFEDDWSNPTFYAKDLYINNELLTDVKITTADSIKNCAFFYCQSIKSVEIGNSVTYIGRSAFSGCSGLTKVNYLGTVDKWVEIDFEGYYSNPTYYAKDLYINNELLTDVKITSADSIKGCAFYKCQSIKSVEIGKSVTSIGGYAFEGCSGLTSVTIPNSVTSIGNYTFYGTGIYNNESNWDNGVLYIDNYLIKANSDVVKGSYTIKEGTRLIGIEAFSGCSGLTSVTIPNSVTSIGNIAFGGCSGLTSVTIPNSVTSIGSSTFYYCSELTSVTIPNSVTSIGGGAFYGCSGLTSVTIPNSVTSVDYHAFYGCSGLTSVIWNAKNCEDFSSYSSSPFYECSNITSFTFGNEVEHIPAYLCYGMNKLTEITIPNSVTSIGSSAFSGCSGLTKVNYLGNVDKWVEIDFNDYDSNPTYYAKDLYINNELLTDVKITTADSIKNYAFYNCQSIKSVEIGEGVTSIGEDAFYGCDKLRKVTAYPTTVPNVYEYSFAHYNAALYVPCDVYDDYFFDDVWGTFKVTDCIAAEEVDAPEKVEIEVDEDNNANVIWPSTDGAKKYELEISKDGEVFCTLLFNENGQLTSIDFGNRAASVGFQFTVTGLDSASKYAYSMVAMDKKGNELQSYKGTFTTNGYVPGPGEEDEPSAIIETLADANITISNGLITCPDTEFAIYNTIGQDVTPFNGSLQPGVYLISIENDIVKVMVK